MNWYKRVSSQVAKRLKTYDPRKLGKTRKISKPHILLPNAQSSSRNKKIISTNKNLLKIRLDFSRSALFHMKTRVYLKYFVNDCLWR